MKLCNAQRRNQNQPENFCPSPLASDYMDVTKERSYFRPLKQSAKAPFCVLIGPQARSFAALNGTFKTKLKIFAPPRLVIIWMLQKNDLIFDL